METKIIMNIKQEDKQRFRDSADRLALTLSGFIKMSASEKANEILGVKNE